MKIKHITFGGNTAVRDTRDILPSTKEFFKPFQQGCVTQKIPGTPFTCRVLIENNIAAFDLLIDDQLICTNLCCFAKEDREPVLLYAKDLVQRLYPTTLLIAPKEDLFFITILINPLAAMAHLATAGEIELYIYDAINEGIKKRSSSSREGREENKPSQGTVFEVGKRFPWDKYIGLGDKTIPVFNDAFFDVVLSFTEPTNEEIRAFRKGNLEIGLYPYKNVPLIYLDFGGFSVDFSLNINKVLVGEDIDNWLNGQANVIHLFLIDGETGILMVQRLISINFSEDIRGLLEEQTGQTIEETDNIIIEATNCFTTAQIQQRAIKKMFFK